MTTSEKSTLPEPLCLLRLREVSKIVGLQPSTIYAKVKKSEFPAPIKIGYASRWLESEVNTWIEKQIAATRGGPVAA